MLSVALVTGCCGLIGSETARHFARWGMDVVGIDNDMRRNFFGDEASTQGQRKLLAKELGPRFRHYDVDIRDTDALRKIFSTYGSDIQLIVHTAAQPSHDWAARDPQTDFGVNAVGTLNLLEAARQHCPSSVFIFTSTNKVYGDSPNRLPLVELESRWEIDVDHRYYRGVNEEMSIDQSLHSVFGASKVAADVMVQEYGRYFGMNTVCFRGGCLTGPQHAGVSLHGFLSYLVKCVVTGAPYTIYGYGGKQVRDNIHCYDLVQAFASFFEAPRIGEVYNIGGGRKSNCSMLEAIALCEEISGRKANYTLSSQARSGDHVWWVSDLRKFQGHYPEWEMRYDVPSICQEIYEAQLERSSTVA